MAIESDLKEVALEFLKDKKLSDEDMQKASSMLIQIEKDLNTEFERLEDKFRDKLYDVGGIVRDKKYEIIKKSLENLAKNLS